MLRDAVVHLAATADVQSAYLDQIFAGLTDGGNAAGFGNEELALEFNDIFLATAHMRDHNEITKTEISAVRPLAELLDQYCRSADDRFWQRDALYSDRRWQQLRACAIVVLRMLPDEERDSNYLRLLRGEPN
jgi:hypothetical protein